MKKILILILSCFSYFIGSSQSVIQRSTATNTVQDARWMGQFNMFVPRYNDTTAANLQKGIDSCGAMIFTYDYNGYWFRACNPKRWLQIIPSGNPTKDTLYWKIGGNNLSALASDRPHLGSTDSSEVNFITNNQIRIAIPPNGIVRNSNANLKNIKYDTTTKLLYYYDDGGSGGGGVSSISQGYGIANTPNPITTTGTVAVDTTVIASRDYSDENFYLANQFNDSTFTIERKDGTADTIVIETTASLVPSDTTNKWVSNIFRVAGKDSIFYNIGGNIYKIKDSTGGVDTSSLSNRINLKVNISDTANMLNPYLRETDTASLSNRINLKLNISDTAAMMKRDTTSAYLILDATTSSTTAVGTGLRFQIGANQTFIVMIDGTASKATTNTGLKLAIGAPTSCTIKGYAQLGAASASTAMTNSLITAINTLGNTFATGIGVEVPFRLVFTVTNGANAGTIELQFATVTSNTATIFAGTNMRWQRTKGL